VDSLVTLFTSPPSPFFLNTKSTTTIATREMTTTEYTRVDEGGDPLTSAGPVHPSIAELVTEGLVQIATKGLYETLVPPPSYSSSAPLLTSTPADADFNTEANQPAPSPPQPPLTMSLWDWCKGAITMGAMFMWICGWGVIVRIGVDPLAFSMLAFFLVLALVYYILIVCYLQFYL
jgi:hypothetical protein